jgi:hypothetical protein
MEINGEVNIEIDQYADVNIELDTEDLAETLCQDHDLVDSVVMHNYVDEHMDGVIEQIDGVVLDVDELRERIRELSPDNNYVRINDLHTTIKEVVDARLVELFTKLIKED